LSQSRKDASLFLYKLFIATFLIKTDKRKTNFKILIDM